MFIEIVDLLTVEEISKAREMTGTYIEKCAVLRPRAYLSAANELEAEALWNEFYERFPDNRPTSPDDGNRADEDFYQFTRDLFIVEHQLEILASFSPENDEYGNTKYCLDIIQKHLPSAEKRIHKLRRKPWWSKWKESINYALESVKFDVQARSAQLQLEDEEEQ